jgi:hypothetical protein
MEAVFPGAEPAGPAGLCTFEWILGGSSCLSGRSTQPPGPPEKVLVVGPDAQGVDFTQHYFDCRGVTPLSCRQRFVGNFIDDGARIDGQWGVFHDGTNWEHDFALIYKRIT